MSESQLCSNYSDNYHMLIFTLKKQWFEKIASGEKTIEFRECKPFWNSRLQPAGSELKPIKAGYLIKNAPNKCILTLGYTKTKLYADIAKIEIWNEKKNDLGINPVYAIYLKNVRRTE